MDLGLKDKAAIVAGASKGLGYAVALALAREGVRVAICSRDAERVRHAAEQIARETGAAVLPVPCDVTRADEIERLVQTTVSAFGTVHICVTNTGGPPAKPFMELADEQWQAAVENTLFSAVRLSRACIPLMQKNEWGRIIHVGSFTVKLPVDNLMLSNSIRAAVVGLGKTQSIELGRYSITVNSVLPGWTQTERVTELVQDRARRAETSTDEQYARITREIPLERMGRPEEFANVVAFLASERASYVTGVALNVDGGISRYPF